MSDDYKETIQPDAFKDLPKTVPVIWDYRYDEVIGSAVVNSDGSVTMTITDKRLTDQIVRDAMRGVSIHHEPATQMSIIKEPLMPDNEVKAFDYLKQKWI